MENRKEELYSQVIPAGKRRYFFDVKETRGGDKFVTITESRKIFDNNTGEFYFDKNKLFLYKEDFEKFQQGLANALSFIETGIEPPPVVVEDENHEAPSSNINIDGSAVLDDINFTL
jgi:SPX domain protein involved in polyphosphate accumulation